MRPPRTSWPASPRPVTIKSRARFDRDDRMPYMKMNWIYVFAAAALVILAVAAVLVVSSVRSAASPVQALSEQVGTQVAQILHPTPTIRPDPVAIVREVRALARLGVYHSAVARGNAVGTGAGVL